MTKSTYMQLPSFSFTENNLHINDSYKVSKKDFILILTEINRQIGDRCKVFLRTYESLYAEWGVHNICYKFHILRSHTADVDLNVPQKFDCIYRILWCLFGWTID